MNFHKLIPTLLGAVAAVMLIVAGAHTVSAGVPPGPGGSKMPAPCTQDHIPKQGGVCVPCPAGQHAAPGEKFCHGLFPCGVNQIRNKDLKCVTCPYGTVADIKANVCSAKDHCLGETILDTAGPPGKCKMCPKGQHADYYHLSCSVDKP